MKKLALDESNHPVLAFFVFSSQLLYNVRIQYKI